MSTMWQCCTKRSTSAATQAAPGNTVQGEQGTEVDVDGDRAVGSTAALLAEHGERAGVVGAAGDGLARRGAEDLGAVEVEQVHGLGGHEADVAAE